MACRSDRVDNTVAGMLDADSLGKGGRQRQYADDEEFHLEVGGGGVNIKLLWTSGTLWGSFINCYAIGACLWKLSSSGQMDIINDIYIL